MSTLSEKLQLAVNSKNAIKSVLSNKYFYGTYSDGSIIDTDTKFSEYANKIGEILPKQISEASGQTFELVTNNNNTFLKYSIGSSLGCGLMLNNQYEFSPVNLSQNELLVMDDNPNGYYTLNFSSSTQAIVKEGEGVFRLVDKSSIGVTLGAYEGKYSPDGSTIKDFTLGSDEFLGIDGSVKSIYGGYYLYGNPNGSGLMEGSLSTGMYLDYSGATGYTSDLSNNICMFSMGSNYGQYYDSSTKTRRVLFNSRSSSNGYQEYSIFNNNQLLSSYTISDKIDTSTASGRKYVIYNLGSSGLQDVCLKSSSSEYSTETQSINPGSFATFTTDTNSVDCLEFIDPEGGSYPCSMGLAINSYIQE